jgi:hypothetical protein
MSDVAPDLAEEVARAQVGDVLAAARDLGRALLDRHEFVGELALLDERGAGLDLALLGEGRDRGELVVGHRLEQLDGLQALGFHSGDPIRPERPRASPGTDVPVPPSRGGTWGERR